jgi:hypothetical protein
MLAQISTSDRSLGQSGRELLLEAILVDDDGQPAALPEVIPHDVFPFADIIAVSVAESSLLSAFPDFDMDQAGPLQDAVQAIVQLDQENDESLKHAQAKRNKLFRELMLKLASCATAQREARATLIDPRRSFFGLSETQKRRNAKAHERLEELQLQEDTLREKKEALKRAEQRCEPALSAFLPRTQYLRRREDLLAELTDLCGTPFLEQVSEDFEAYSQALQLDYNSLLVLRKALNVSVVALNQMQESMLLQLRSCCETECVAERFPELRDTWTDPEFHARSFRHRVRLVAGLIEERISVLESSMRDREKEKRLIEDLRKEQQRVFRILEGIFTLPYKVVII